MEIHHRIPQMYIGKNKLFPPSMRRSLSNLQALSVKNHRMISGYWANFRRNNPNPTRSEVLKFAMQMDKIAAEYINIIN